MSKKLFFFLALSGFGQQRAYCVENWQIAAAGAAGSTVLSGVLYYVAATERNSLTADIKNFLQGIDESQVIKLSRDYLDQGVIKQKADAILHGTGEYRFNQEPHEVQLMRHQEAARMLLERQAGSLNPWHWFGSKNAVAQQCKQRLQEIDGLLHEYNMQRIQAFLATSLAQEVALAAEQYMHNPSDARAKHKSIQEVLKLVTTLRIKLSASFTGYRFFDGTDDDHACKEAQTIELASALRKLNEQAKFLEIMNYWGRVLLLNVDSSAQLVERVKAVPGDTAYIFIEVAKAISREIGILKSMKIASLNYVEHGIQLLTNVLNRLKATDEYRADLRAYDLAVAQQRQIQAAQEAAQAVRDAARAARQVADSVEDLARAADMRN